jgi:hypothetical protein
MRFILALCIMLLGVPALACDSNCGVRDEVAVPSVPPSPPSKDCETDGCYREPVLLFGRVLGVTEDVNNPNQRIITLGDPDAPVVFGGPHQ